MKRDRKALAALVLAPLIAGPAVLLGAESATALPAATCTMTAHTGPGSPVIEINGGGFPPNSKVAIGASAAGAFTTTTTADGTFRYALPGTAEAAAKANLTVTGTDVSATCVLAATTPDEVPNNPQKDPQKDPGTEQEDAQSQYRKGFSAGMADARDDCKKAPPKQGAAAVDPNFVKGYLVGQETGFGRYCGTTAP
ncbi:hypothetical protein ACGFXC_26680 [Streptomyces sp. NPDC048507]|uniref:hypothetical protein n=1 Tax=Streptomyces sp. NPDC048507 TaxID=3365560 RepID=UPI0037117ACB